VRRRRYLDHAATSFPKAPGVSAAVARCLDESSGNPGRGGHGLTVAASRVVEHARDAVGDLLGADPARVLLGPGATFWLNTVVASLVPAGGRVVVSSLEHNAVMRPLRHLERTRGVRVDALAGEGASGVPSAGEAAEAVRGAPADLVVLTHASNVSGAVVPVEEIAEAVAPVPVLVDGAQSAGALEFRFDETKIAAFACSGHKSLLGPPGTGVLLLAPTTHVAPLVRGGTGSRSESEEMPDVLPDGLEPGTPNVAGYAGLGAACAWIRAQGVDMLAQRQAALAQRLVGALSDVPGVRLVGVEPGAPRLAVASFVVDGLDPGELARWLDAERGLMLRVGLHCAPAAHRRIGTFPDGTLRASLGPLADASDVDMLVEALCAARQELARTKR
jgi:selenocysteine lyase/cysteine desulfurase